MPKNKPLETSHVESIETAWHKRDEVQMLKNLVAKYARVLDMTDSGRDIKPLATGMLEAMDRLKAIDADDSELDDFEEILDEL
jgi:hypothetical protein